MTIKNYEDTFDGLIPYGKTVEQIQQSAYAHIITPLADSKKRTPKAKEHFYRRSFDSIMMTLFVGNNTLTNYGIAGILDALAYDFVDFPEEGKTQDVSHIVAFLKEVFDPKLVDAAVALYERDYLTG